MFQEKRDRNGTTQNPYLCLQKQSTMTPKTRQISTVTFLIALLFGWGLIQPELKNKPQIALIIWGLITYALSFTQRKWLFKIPFYLILGTLVFATSFGVFIELSDLLTPVEINGQYHGTNGGLFYAILGTLIGSVATIIFLFIYHKKIRLAKTIEKNYSLAFTLFVLSIWILDEVFNIL